MKNVLVMFMMFSMCFSSGLIAKENDPKKAVDYIALAALLVSGGDFLKADEVLSKVDIFSNKTEKKKLDLKRYYTIKGLLKLRLQQYENARDSYLKARLYGQTNKNIFVYLAQAYFGLDDFDNTLKSLDEADGIWLDNPRIWLLKSLSYSGKKEFNNMMQVLLQAEQRFPNEKQFTQRRIFLLIQLGLYQRAVQEGLIFLKNHKPSDETAIVDYQTIAKAMIEAGQYSSALPILEKATLVYPYNVKLLRLLSRTYVLLNHFYVAAIILEKAAAQDISLFGEVAELYRKAKKPEQALYFNQIVVDQNVKFRQRLAIYLDAGRFDDAIGMKETLYRVGLLKDGSIRYALAYAYFSVGNYQQTEKYLEGLRKPDLFRKATQLRSAVLSCNKSPLQC